MNSGIGVLLDNIGLHHFGVWVVRALVVAIVRCQSSCINNESTYFFKLCIHAWQ
jgi:hypothetical protein